MKAKSWTCEICHESVSELGAYAKLSVTKYAHLTCYTKHHVTIAFQAGQQSVRDEIAEAALKKLEYERAEREQQAQVAERERTNRILAAKNNPLPPRLEPKKEVPSAKEEERPDRFKLIDID